VDHTRRTQRSYDLIAAQFFARHQNRSVLHPWMVRFAAAVPAGGVVLDLGAGPCHDSAQLRALGLSVISLDRSKHMLNVASERFPGARVQADLRQLPFRPNSIAGVWASASLLHLDRHELAPALAGVREVLVESGVLFMSLKRGAGEGWETTKYGGEAPRWFTYWHEQDVDAALLAAGFDLVEAATRAGTEVEWLMRIARRCIDVPE